MIQRIPLKNIIVITSVVLLALLICFLLYFQIVKPISQQVQTAERELNTEKQLLELIEEKEDITSEEKNDNTVDLQNEIPVKPMVDQFLLAVEKVEKDAKVFLKEISLNEEQLEEVAEQDRNEVSEDTNSENPILQPMGLKKITVHMEIEADSFPSLEKFLIDIEKMSRTTHIAGVRFEAPTTDDEEITFSVDLSVYYFPDLIDLFDAESVQNPPDPANKKLPF